MAKTLTKKELRAPDQFQAIGRMGANWIEDNIKMIIGAVLAVAAISIGWISYGYYQSSKETQAEATLFPLQETALKSISEGNASESLQLSGYIEGLRSHSGTKSAGSSAILVITALSEKENTESLQKEVMLAADLSPSERDVVFGLWYLTKGQVLARNGEMADAKAAYQRIVQSAAQKDFHPLALLQLGALSQKEGDTTAAKDFYKRVTVEFPESEAKRTAEKLLIHLDLLGQGAIKGS